MAGSRILHVFHAMALVAGLSTLAFAQDARRSPPPVPVAGVKVDGDGVPYRPWDVAVSAGLHVDNDVQPRARPPGALYNDDDWRAGLGVQVDLGRYWTSHVKTELAFAYLTGYETFESDLVDVPTGVGQAFYQTDVARRYVGAAVTYQFFDNVFAHPYVSGGARIGIFDRHRVRSSTAWVSDRSSSREYPLPPLETRDRDVQVRPYVAAGFKSYLNERAFIRSELSTAFADRGLVHWALRLGFGVDF